MVDWLSLAQREPIDVDAVLAQSVGVTNDETRITTKRHDGRAPTLFVVAPWQVGEPDGSFVVSDQVREKNAGIFVSALCVPNEITNVVHGNGPFVNVEHVDAFMELVVPRDANFPRVVHVFFYKKREVVLRLQLCHDVSEQYGVENAVGRFAVTPHVLGVLWDDGRGNDRNGLFRKRRRSNHFEVA